MSTIQPEVLNHMISVISEIDPAHLDNREVIAYLAGISETATGMLQLKPDLKAHADLVMDLANRAFHASRETEARNAALWTEVETLRAEVARLTKQRDAFYLQLNDARHETDQQRAKRIVLRSKMIAVEEERDQARADLAALHAEAARLRAALDRAERDKAHELVDELMAERNTALDQRDQWKYNAGIWENNRHGWHRRALEAEDERDAMRPVVEHAVSLVISLKTWGEEARVNAFAEWPGLVAAATAYVDQMAPSGPHVPPVDDPGDKT